LQAASVSVETATRARTDEDRREIGKSKPLHAPPEPSLNDNPDIETAFSSTGV
jgi:hypothetical protein